MLIWKHHLRDHLDRCRSIKYKSLEMNSIYQFFCVPKMNRLKIFTMLAIAFAIFNRNAANSIGLHASLTNSILNMDLIGHLG